MTGSAERWLRGCRADARRKADPSAAFVDARKLLRTFFTTRSSFHGMTFAPRTTFARRGGLAMIACFNRASVERDLGKGHLKASRRVTSISSLVVGQFEFRPSCVTIKKIQTNPLPLLFAPACLREVYRKKTITFKLVVSCGCGVTPL